MDLSLDRWLNVSLIKEPLNWAIVWVMASVALLLFHTVMQAFGAMRSTSSFGGGPAPGTVAIQTPDSIYAQPGTLAGSRGSSLSSFWAGGLNRGDGVWTDGAEAKYAEDGWIGNS